LTAPTVRFDRESRTRRSWRQGGAIPAELGGLHRCGPVRFFKHVGFELRQCRRGRDGHRTWINVIVAQRKDGQWFNPVRARPMSKDQITELEWLGRVNDTGHE